MQAEMYLFFLGVWLSGMTTCSTPAKTSSAAAAADVGTVCSSSCPHRTMLPPQSIAPQCSGATATPLTFNGPGTISLPLTDREIKQFHLWCTVWLATKPGVSEHVRLRSTSS